MLIDDDNIGDDYEDNDGGGGGGDGDKLTALRSGITQRFPTVPADMSSWNSLDNIQVS